MSSNRKKRSTDTRDILKPFLIACEGSETEPRYFRCLCDELHLPRNNVFGQNETKRGDPKGIVEFVKNKYKGYTKNHVLKQIVKPGDFWCVFDSDDHTNLNDAIQQARDLGFSVAFSNPCFELWYILHYKDHTAPISQTQAKKITGKLIPDYSESMDVYSLLDSNMRRDAIIRAEALRKRHTAKKDPETYNPSTKADLLVEYLVDLSRERWGIASR